MGGEITFRCAGGGRDQVKIGLRWFWLNGADLFEMVNQEMLKRMI